MPMTASSAAMPVRTMEVCVCGPRLVLAPLPDGPRRDDDRESDTGRSWRDVRQPPRRSAASATLDVVPQLVRPGPAPRNSTVHPPAPAPSSRATERLHARDAAPSPVLARSARRRVRGPHLDVPQPLLGLAAAGADGVRGRRG